jgi:hypothetical protein
MKRLPIYGLLITGYVIIIVGVVKLYNSLLKIETVDIPAQHLETTSLGIVPMIIIGVFVLILLSSIGVYLLTELWKYFATHKTLLPLPFLLIGVGFIQLSNKIMQGVKVMIESNAELFTDNLTTYINAFQTLNTYTYIGIGFIVASVGYSFYLKFTA